MKKVLIDAFSLLSPLTGIGRYTYENSKIIKKSFSDHYEIYFNYGYHSKQLYHDSAKNKGTVIKSIKSVLTKFEAIKKISRKLYKHISSYSNSDYDLYWQPNIIPNTAVNSKKIVTTLHDFSFKVEPSWHSKEKIEYFNQEFYSSIMQSDWIITGSNFTKQEIIDYLDYPEEKITVIYHGVNHNIYKVYENTILEVTRKKYHLPQHFLLCVGSIEPRKNLLNLLKSYNELSHEVKQEYPLVLVGFKGWENTQIMAELEKTKKNILYLGYLSDDELAHVYNLATIFIYPTLYEGFGIPPLEAFACATAVIASNTSSIPEVCGDAVLYIDPTNCENITLKIQNLINDIRLRQSLVKKGLQRVKNYSWERSAQEHHKVFEMLLKD